MPLAPRRKSCRRTDHLHALPQPPDRDASARFRILIETPTAGSLRRSSVVLGPLPEPWRSVDPTEAHDCSFRSADHDPSPPSSTSTDTRAAGVKRPRVGGDPARDDGVSDLLDPWRERLRDPTESAPDVLLVRLLDLPASLLLALLLVDGDAGRRLHPGVGTHAGTGQGHLRGRRAVDLGFDRDDDRDR